VCAVDRSWWGLGARGGDLSRRSLSGVQQFSFSRISIGPRRRYSTSSTTSWDGLGASRYLSSRPRVPNYSSGGRTGPGGNRMQLRRGSPARAAISRVPRAHCALRTRSVTGPFTYYCARPSLAQPQPERPPAPPGQQQTIADAADPPRPPSTSEHDGVPIFPDTSDGRTARLADYEPRKLNNLPHSLYDNHNATRGRAPPDERRARARRDNRPPR
jgi:hypothetical protein